MCVSMQMLAGLPHTPVQLNRRLVHSPSRSVNRLSDTPSPLLAGRKRRMCGMSSSRSPMYCTYSSSNRYLLPPDTTISTSGVVL